MTGRRIKTILLVVAVLVAVHTPLALHVITLVRIERSGVEVVATVTQATSYDDGSYRVRYLLPAEIDPDGYDWGVQVDRATFEQASETGEIDVRVVPGSPAAHVVEGQEPSWAIWWLTLLVDLAMVLILLIVWRVTRAFRPEPVRIEALADVAPGAGPMGMSVEGDLVTVCGRVLTADADETVLDAGGRMLVVVVLDQRASGVPVGAVAQARGRLLT